MATNAKENDPARSEELLPENQIPKVTVKRKNDAVVHLCKVEQFLICFNQSVTNALVE